MRPGMPVVGLGAASGGWTQVALRVLGDKGRLIASGILPVGNIVDVTFIPDAFADGEVHAQILVAIGK